MSAVVILAALAASAAPAQPQRPVESGSPIVVTGVRPEDARRRLEACLARNCPPMEDMAASLAYAEALFVSGDYGLSASILRRSIGRNRREAERLPIAVAGLYRAHARVSIHQGDGEAYRRSTWSALRTLRNGLGDDDARVLAARLEAAGMHVSLAEADEAEDIYRSAAEQARRIGRPDLEATADLRRGWLYHQQGRSDGRALMERVMRLSDPQTRIQQYSARILLARIDREAGDLESSDRLIEELATAGFGVPVLVYSPPIEIGDRPTGSRANANHLPVYNVANMEPNASFDYWADIGFWVTPEGRVEEAELLRSHGEDYWIAPVLSSVERRVYAPAGTDTAEPSYRIERFSYTSLLERRTASRILGHSAQGRIESIDLSADTAPPRQP